MDLGLSGRRALVTGSSAGIGTSVARRLLEEGCAVVLHGRNRERLEGLRDDLSPLGDVTTVRGDLSDSTSAAQVCEQAVDRGPIDILVANAGPFSEETVLGSSDEEWLAAFDGNVLSALRCARVLAAPMRSRGWGRIVTIGSRAVPTPLPTMAPYSAAKAALLNATVALAQELAGTGITVNAVSPGVILTPGLEEMFAERERAAGGTRTWSDLEPEVTADYAPSPAGRLGRADDIADAVAFLASARASFVNGAVLRVDGGITGTLGP